MGLTDKYQNRLGSSSGPLTYIDKLHTAVHYTQQEVALVREAAKYMECDPVPILSRPAVGYRILCHIDNGHTLESACELFGRENRKGE